MMKYSHKTSLFNGVPANLHFFIGLCPLTGQDTGLQIKDMTEDQLEAWYKLDRNAAAKYVVVTEVPDTEEPGEEERKAEQKQIDEIKSETGRKRKAGKKTETRKDTGGAGIEPDNEQ